MKLVPALIAAFCLPLKILIVTSGFGYRIHPLTGKYAFHNGVDLRASRDTVFAIMDGQINTAGYDRQAGLHVIIDHGAITTIYGHLVQIFVMRLDQVVAGQPIGISGATGRATGPHLHFAIRYGHQFIDPIEFLYGLLIQKENEKKL